MFTDKELEILDKFDKQIDEEDFTLEDYKISREIDEILSSKYRDANRKAYEKSYREANRERLREYQREYRKANKEKICANKRPYNRAYYQANKEKICAYKRELYQKNKLKGAKNNG